MTSAARDEKSPSLGDVCGAAAFAIGLVSAWLYVAGWTYAYQYFDRFGIPLLMVDIPKEHYFVYGDVVARQFPAWLLAIVTMAFLLVAMRRWLARLLGALALPIAILAVAGLFWLGHSAGVAAALDQYATQREGDYPAYPRVQIWLTENSPASGGSPSPNSLAQGCYRLLLHNLDRLFLIRPFKGAGAADLPVLILPWDQVGAVRVLPDYTSCK